MPYYSVKTTASREQSVANMFAEKGGEDIYAAMAPKGLTGYVIIEAKDAATIERVMDKVPNVHKLLQGQASEQEVLEFLTPTSDVENISEQDLVEITEGPFSGQKGIIQNIDEGEGQVTVGLKEATVPIPVTMKGSQVRRLDSEERE